MTEDQRTDTRTPGAWLRAALELESWINDSYMDSFTAKGMRERVADLRARAGRVQQS